MPASVILIYLVLFGSHILVLWLLFARKLPPTGRRLIILLYALHIVLIVLHVISRGWSADLQYYFNFKFGEHNPSASYSAAQYLLVTFTCLMIALLAEPRRWWHRLYWLLIALVFFYFSQDEYMIIHENINGWQLMYLGAAGLLAVVTVLVYFIGMKRQQLWTFVLLFGGLGVAALGGAGLEYLGAANCLGWAGPCSELPYFEESLEIMGVLTVLVDVMMYAWAHIPAASWTNARRVIVYGGLISFVAFLAGPWVAPPLELKFIASPAYVDYGESGMVVVGYYTSQTQLKPGDTLNVRLYWRRGPSIGHDYGLSLKSAQQPERPILRSGQHDDHRPGVLAGLSRHDLPPRHEPSTR